MDELTITKEQLSPICSLYKSKYGKEVKRWFSTYDPIKIKEAILLLVITDYGFSVSINAPAFKPKFEADSILAIYRTGYGVTIWGPIDYWHVSFNGIELKTFDDPEQAVDYFMQQKIEREIGQDICL